MTDKKRPVLLCILDGWGEGNDKDNAILAANTPNWDSLSKEYPKAHLGTSGLDVGLPDGQMGNSEVGHMNIGGGRVVMQNLPKIDAAIADGSLKENKKLKDFIEKLKASGGKCHIMGLVSDGGVHSHMNHIKALADIVGDNGIEVLIHAFTDGRDTPPESGKEYIKTFDKYNIATVSGRYFAMDRDNRWERVEIAYNAMISGEGEKGSSAADVISAAYGAGTTDEFITPTVIGNYAGMNDGDAVLMANFRSDRARQMLTAILDEKFDGFERKKKVSFSAALGMVSYSDELNKILPAIFEAENLTHTLGEIMADKGLTQLRIAETEKYAHVTFFFNGGVEKEFKGEDRILVPSPKVATYDLQPEMSASGVTDKLVEAIESEKYDLIVVNYANTDMVGHTGNIEAAKKAVEAVDIALGRLHDAIKKVGGAMLITADHGNAELMVDPETGEPHTAHTTNPVPFIVIDGKEVISDKGKLCDIAPTILKIMDIEQPKQMTGKSLCA